MVVRAPEIAKKIKPGQFIMLRIDEQGERIPLTMNDCDPEAGTITIIFQAVGATTIRLAQMKAGDALQDFAGPLGNPTEPWKARSARASSAAVWEQPSRFLRPSGCTTMAARWMLSPASATRTSCCWKTRSTGIPRARSS